MLKYKNKILTDLLNVYYNIAGQDEHHRIQIAYLVTDTIEDLIHTCESMLLNASELQDSNVYYYIKVNSYQLTDLAFKPHKKLNTNKEQSGVHNLLVLNGAKNRLFLSAVIREYVRVESKLKGFLMHTSVTYRYTFQLSLSKYGSVS